MPDRDEIRALVRAALDRRLAESAERPAGGGSRARRTVITEADVLAARAAGSALHAPADAVVTPLARETAARFGVRLAAEAPEAVAAADGPAACCAAPKVAVASDHAGFELKERLRTFLAGEGGLTVIDLGTAGTEPVDYPDLAAEAARAVAAHRACFAVVVDGAGIGSAIAANKVRGVRAAPCSTLADARNARSHNDANVLCLGGRTLEPALARAIALVFLTTDFEGGRHLARVRKIAALEDGACTSHA